MAKRRLLLLGVGLALAGNAPAQGQKALGELFSGDASVRGSVLLRAQATEVLSGSQVAAGEGSALLKLARGGQLRICPKTNLSLNADVRGKSLSLGLNAGAMELEYALESGADSLITPDFRLQLIGPGSFHLAISVATSGDTCLRSLPGNSAAVFVSEMMGSDSYQLSPGKNVLFLKGKISLATAAPELCGCPQIAPPSATELARTDPAENARPHPDRKNLATAATDRQPTNGQPVPVERPVPLEEKPRLSQERSPAAAAVSPAQPAEEQVRRAPASASLPSVSTKPEAPDTGQKKPEPSNAEPSNLEHPNPEPSASEQSNPEPSNTESSK